MIEVQRRMFATEHGFNKEERGQEKARKEMIKLKWKIRRLERSKKEKRMTLDEKQQTKRSLDMKTIRHKKLSAVEERTEEDFTTSNGELAIWLVN